MFFTVKHIISDDSDIDIAFSATVFNESSYVIYYNTWEGGWSSVKEQEIKLTEVLFNIEE